MSIINSDTTWAKNSVITLTENVQIGFGNTLTIEEGVTINANGYAIQVFGILSALASASSMIEFNNTVFKFGANHNTPGEINLSHVQINSGSFLAATGNASYGSFQISDSIFDTVSGFYIWYPEKESSFIRNIFLNSTGLSIGTRENVTIENNLFIGNVGAAGENWAAYSGAVVEFTKNSFLNSDYYALALKPN